MVLHVAITPPRLPVHAGQPAKLRDLGYDEIWLQNWLAHDPARLGLGEIMNRRPGTDGTKGREPGHTCR